MGPWSDIYALGMVAYRCISGISDSELPDAVTRGRTQRKGVVDLTPATETGKGKCNSKLLEAIDWAIEVDEEGRPQTVDAWRQALAGGGRRQGQTRSVRRTATRLAKGETTERTGTNWSGVVMTVVVLALLGVSVWMAMQLYPKWFKLDSGESLPVAQQENTGRHVRRESASNRTRGNWKSTGQCGSDVTSGGHITTTLGTGIGR